MSADRSELAIINDMLKNDILRNYSQKHLGVLWGDSLGLGFSNEAKMPCWHAMLPQKF